MTADADCRSAVMSRAARAELVRSTATVHYRIATGPHAGRKALTLRAVGSNPPADNPLHRSALGILPPSPPRMV